MGIDILKIYVVIMLVSTAIWCVKKTPRQKLTIVGDIFSVVSIPIVLFTTLFLLEKGMSGPAGTPGGWYFIFSLLSFGLLPAITATSFWFFGRGIGRLASEIIKFGIETHAIWEENMHSQVNKDR